MDKNDSQQYRRRNITIIERKYHRLLEENTSSQPFLCLQYVTERIQKQKLGRRGRHPCRIVSKRKLSMMPNELFPVLDRSAPRLLRVAELSGKEEKDRKVALIAYTSWTHVICTNIELTDVLGHVTLVTDC